MEFVAASSSQTRALGTCPVNSAGLLAAAPKTPCLNWLHPGAQWLSPGPQTQPRTVPGRRMVANEDCAS